MKSMLKWQAVSFISRSLAMVMGLIQSFVIVRILSVGEWGIVQLAVSIGSSFGIYQHLGLASGSTREISAAKDEKEISKIFFTAVAIRYVVTIPIALFLFFGASYLGVTKYGNADLVLPIRIYSLVLLFQGVQSLLNSVISGTKRFKHLFIYQSAISVVSVLIYIPLVLIFKINGYFYALLAFNIVASMTLTVLAFSPLKGNIALPTKEDFKDLLKQLLSITLAIYAIKVIYTWWQNSGNLILGNFLNPEAVGFFAFALLYGKKFMLISDSVTAVNLPILSEKFSSSVADFKESFLANFNKIFAFLMLPAIVGIYWAPEIIRILVGSDKYVPSLPLILPLGFAFIFYALINVVTSSVVIPAKFVKQMIVGYLLMLFTTAASFFVIRITALIDPLLLMSYAMLLGTVIAFIYIVTISGKKLSFSFISVRHLLVLFAGFMIASQIGLSNIYLKTGVFFVAFSAYLWFLISLDFLQVTDLKVIISKGKGILKKNER